MSQKEDPNVTKQDWFIEAMERMENIHFSTPHVKNLFDDGSMRYHLVLSLIHILYGLVGAGRTELLETIFGIRTRAAAVSYTHLDVYKRQLLARRT